MRFSDYEEIVSKIMGELWYKIIEIDTLFPIM